ncbi:MAG: hypothetical protein EPN17_06150 [Methylobacter sp.]|nr:MAG: hypothetical protein EPN17_06150 [Methylobacter sp.]
MCLASSQASVWEFSTGSSSFPSREATTCMDARGRATQERLPRASLTGFPSRRLGTSVFSTFCGFRGLLLVSNYAVADTCSAWICLSASR